MNGANSESMVDLIHFNQDEYIEGDDLQERFGLRGRNMLQLAALKTPIAPGFLIEAAHLANGSLEEQLTIQSLESAVKKIEKSTGKTFNAADRPLLFKAVISPSIQIGTLRSLHAIGISDEVARGFANYCGEEFAYHGKIYEIRSVIRNEDEVLINVTLTVNQSPF